MRKLCRCMGLVLIAAAFEEGVVHRSSWGQEGFLPSRSLPVCQASIRAGAKGTWDDAALSCTGLPSDCSAPKN